MADQVETFCSEGERRCAFLSTPSIYYSLKNKSVKASSKNLDFDTSFSKDPNFVFYDFNHPDKIPEELHHQFHLVVIDPPFITEEVWQKYQEASKLLLVEEGGHALLSTIDENE